jgi:branched-chain amino acid aminotransferase
MILSGITRKYILNICRDVGIEVKMESVKAGKITAYDAVFMTGTSPMVLPFNTIDNFKFSVRYPLIDKLRSLYINEVEKSILKFRNE